MRRAYTKRPRERSTLGHRRLPPSRRNLEFAVLCSAWVSRINAKKLMRARRFQTGMINDLSSHISKRRGSELLSSVRRTIIRVRGDDT